jgi:hypothetical protein
LQRSACCTLLGFAQPLLRNTFPASFAPYSCALYHD